MSSRQALDAKASSMMLILCIFWGLQQVVLKVAAADISPLMQLALRSGLSAVMVLPLLLLARNTQWASTEYLPAGILVGILFAAEFFMLGQAIQYTSASHVVVLLYTAPIFVALALHWKLPAERLSRLQWGGILLSFAGIAVTFLWRDTVQQESHQNFSQMLFGDLLALSAGILWAATTVAVRLSRLSEAPATQTLFYQLMGGFLILLPMAWWMEPYVFRPNPIGWWSWAGGCSLAVPGCRGRLWMCSPSRPCASSGAGLSFSAWYRCIFWRRKWSSRATRQVSRPWPSGRA